MTKEALRLALEALTNAYWPTDSDLLPAHNIKECGEAITAIKAALEAKDEPVANNWSVFNTGAEVWDNLCLADAVVELTPSRLERGWSAVCVINKDNPPLYTTPPQRKPLTDEEVIDIGTQCQWYDGDCERFDSIGFARAIEAAHGIKGEA